SVFLRNTDGSPAVKLGDGYASGLSPDGKFVASQLPNDFSHITILPAGAGESKTIRIPGFNFIGASVKCFSDNRRILIAGYKSERPPRWWIYDLVTTELNPITPEAVVGSGPLIHRDQTSVLARTAQGDFSFYSLKGEPLNKAVGLEAADTPLQWTSDGQGVFISERGQNSLQVFRVDLVTGKRTFWKEITPSDPAGIAGGMNVMITPDGKSYAYTYRRVLSDLYLVPGLQ
ncbi:hypothetical protein L0152_23605, partial [bacterium]|nr:hypothetical protein [bacterium]